MAKNKNKNVSINSIKKSSVKISDKESQKQNQKDNHSSNLKLNKVTIKIKKKYTEKQYSESMLMKALNAVKGGQTLRQAARLFGVPKSTLHAKLNNHVSIDCVKGAPTVLSQKEESEIVNWILDCAERGFPITKNHLFDCVQKLLVAEKRKTIFKDNKPGKHWYNGFMKRHPNLSQRIAQNLTSSRASVSVDDLKNWFSNVKNYLEKKDILKLDSSRIFNLDESAFMLVPKDTAVLTRKGTKSVYQIVGGNEKACLTVLFTANACGYLLPPMVLFDLKNSPKKNVLDEIPQGWSVGYSDRGWMTSETFYSYIVNVFYKWLLDNNVQFPVILYVDGHSSHLTLPLMRFCKEFNIEIIALYPNATHIMQPLDVALFHPLKEAYKKTLRTWRIDNDIVEFKKSMFAKVLKLTLDSIDLTMAIKNGFKTCGLCPFDSNAVNYNIFDKEKRKKVISSYLRKDNESLSNNTNSFQLLNSFKTNVITPDILQNFMNNESESWKGDASQKGLFEFWKDLKRYCAPSSFDNSFEVVEDESLNKVESFIQQNNLVHIINNESLELIDDHLPVTEVNSEMEFNLVNVENDGVDECNYEATTTTVLISPENSNSAKTLTTFCITEEDLLDSDSLFSRLISTEEQTIKEKASETDNQFEDYNIHVVECDESVTNNNLNSNCEITDTNMVNTSVNETIQLPTVDEMDNYCHVSQPSINFEATEVLDLSMVSKATDTIKKNDQHLDWFKKAFPVPTFNPKNKKRKLKPNESPTSVRDELLEILQKKENDKILKEQQIWKNKQEKERIKILREKELNVNKDFQERKKKLLEEKKSLTTKIKNLNKMLKSECNKENKDQLLEKKKSHSERLEEINKLLISEEMEALHKKIKIKQEKL